MHSCVWRGGQAGPLHGVYRMRRLGPHTSWLLCVAVLLASSGAAHAADGVSIRRRIRGRAFPSVFQAWSGADHPGAEPALKTMARHDLVFRGPGAFGLRWDRPPAGLATGITPDSVPRGLAVRRQLLELNPNIVLIAEIRYRDAPRGFLPADHPWWRRKDGKPVPGWGEGGFLQLDFSNPDYRRHVARRAGAVVGTGVVDGVMLDWWSDDDERLALVREVRRAVGDDALILANANDRETPRTAPYLNGYFMECYRSKTAADWHRIAETLSWAEAHLREPRVNCVETWYHASRKDLHLMRATTTLVLTRSDGYCLFSDPNQLPTADHRHNWYAFWEKGLGRPVGPGRKRDDGAFMREFDNGFAVYNPMGNREITLRFPEDLTSRATGQTGRTHRLAAPDGDIYLRGPREAREKPV